MSKQHTRPRPLPASLGLPRTGVDSHAHLDSEELWPDFEGVLERAADAGVARIGQVFWGTRPILRGARSWPLGPNCFLSWACIPPTG